MIDDSNHQKYQPQFKRQYLTHNHKEFYIEIFKLLTDWLRKAASDMSEAVLCSVQCAPPTYSVSYLINEMQVWRISTPTL